jgi:hypothetical protein
MLTTEPFFTTQLGSEWDARGDYSTRRRGSKSLIVAHAVSFFLQCLGVYRNCDSREEDLLVLL